MADCAKKGHVKNLLGLETDASQYEVFFTSPAASRHTGAVLDRCEDGAEARIAWAEETGGRIQPETGTVALPVVKGPDMQLASRTVFADGPVLTKRARIAQAEAIIGPTQPETGTVALPVDKGPDMQLASRTVFADGPVLTKRGKVQEQLYLLENMKKRHTDAVLDRCEDGATNRDGLVMRGEAHVQRGMQKLNPGTKKQILSGNTLADAAEARIAWAEETGGQMQPETGTMALLVVNGPDMKRTLSMPVLHLVDVKKLLRDAAEARIAWAEETGGQMQPETGTMALLVVNGPNMKRTLSMPVLHLVDVKKLLRDAAEARIAWAEECFAPRHAKSKLNFTAHVHGMVIAMARKRTLSMPVLHLVDVKKLLRGKVNMKKRKSVPTPSVEVKNLQMDALRGQRRYVDESSPMGKVFAEGERWGTTLWPRDVVVSWWFSWCLQVSWRLLVVVMVVLVAMMVVVASVVVVVAVVAVPCTTALQYSRWISINTNISMACWISRCGRKAIREPPCRHTGAVLDRCEDGAEERIAWAEETGGRIQPETGTVALPVVKGPDMQLASRTVFADGPVLTERDLTQPAPRSRFADDAAATKRDGAEERIAWAEETGGRIQPETGTVALPVVKGPDMHTGAVLDRCEDGAEARIAWAEETGGRIQPETGTVALPVVKGPDMQLASRTVFADGPVLTERDLTQPAPRSRFADDAAATKRDGAEERIAWAEETGGRIQPETGTVALPVVKGPDMQLASRTVFADGPVLTERDLTQPAPRSRFADDAAATKRDGAEERIAWAEETGGRIQPETGTVALPVVKGPDMQLASRTVFADGPVLTERDLTQPAPRSRFADDAAATKRDGAEERIAWAEETGGRIQPETGTVALPVVKGPDMHTGAVLDRCEDGAEARIAWAEETGGRIQPETGTVALPVVKGPDMQLASRTVFADGPVLTERDLTQPAPRSRFADDAAATKRDGAEARIAWAEETGGQMQPETGTMALLVVNGPNMKRALSMPVLHLVHVKKLLRGKVQEQLYLLENMKKRKSAPTPSVEVKNLQMDALRGQR
ncbi:hypothetical protein AK812_SmicGene12158 [Symbiodinium microadriaticum]|uniref:Uncharacterized protein n=1 Tax=Symbiodinium microadriaticum TaxID=2951 RepID=A0A1Q9EBF4_SYMMI|nr:hypothetical protein AK812_SmicGene12158 [Symbiodinium microadriaticum]